jgi:prepilin signal peptidase PulO-like enzyme (type II secretory pathway)
MVWVILFIFGLAIGSFLNVVILRYDGERFLFDTGAIGGRSHCPHCKHTLRWFELVPVVSYIIQGGRCRECRARLTIQYPVVELISGALFAGVPFALGAVGAPPETAIPLALVAALWTASFEALLVMSVIDIRMGIIPDEVVVFLSLVGIFLIIFSSGYFGTANHSLLGPYASLFGWQWSDIFAKLIGAAVGGAFFWVLIAVTRGKGMGMGDLKLAIPLGLIFGWPDIIFVLAFSFVIGGAFGAMAVLLKRNNMQGSLPFGPFLALGAASAFFFGPAIFAWYFPLIGLR